VLTRYTNSGAIDTAFGRVSVAGQYLRGLAIDASDRIVATGWHLGGGGTPELIVGRPLADGSTDTSFGSSGITAVDLGADSAGNAIGIDASGRIVVVADVFGTDADLRPLRFDADGDLDAAFGTGGEGDVLGASGTDTSSLWGLAIDGNGDAVLSGMRFDGTGTDWLVARWCGG